MRRLRITKERLYSEEKGMKIIMSHKSGEETAKRQHRKVGNSLQLQHQLPGGKGRKSHNYKESQVVLVTDGLT
jgi:hypothetical protein